MPYVKKKHEKKVLYRKSQVLFLFKTEDIMKVTLLSYRL